MDGLFTEAEGGPPVHLGFMGNGESYHVGKWLPALAAEGLRVTLFTFHPPPAPLPGVTVVPLDPPFSASPDRMRWHDFAGPVGGLRRAFAEQGIDVLMASYATNYGWMGVRTGFQPLMVHTWTYDVSVYPFKGWKGLVFRPVVRRVLRRARAILTDGAALADFVREHYPFARDRVTPVLWGIRLADYEFTPELRAEVRERYGIPEGAPVVVSARGVSEWYAPEQVLPAFRRLLDARPDLHVIVLTLEHDRSDATQALLDALARHPRAHVEDRFLSRDEMRGIWAASDVLVSVPPHDGISVGILEGMYAGVIPVVSDIPSNRSFLTEGERAFFVPDASAAALTTTLTGVLDDLGRLRREMAPRLRDWVAAHGSVEATARQVAAMVRSLAGAAARV